MTSFVPNHSHIKKYYQFYSCQSRSFYENAAVYNVVYANNLLAVTFYSCSTQLETQHLPLFTPLFIYIYLPLPPSRVLTRDEQ